MSFCITTHVREGIIMAADSRITYNQSVNRDGVKIQKFGVSFSDSTNKLFITPNNGGISSCGDASIKGVPISGFIDSFIAEKLDSTNTIKETAEHLLEYFKNIEPNLNAIFHVAGYQKENDIDVQCIYRVQIRINQCIRKNNNNEQGATWDGETETFSRLVKTVGVKNPDGSYIDLQAPEIQFGQFTLQDAVDFSLYAVRTTIDSIRFQLKNKTVGGPIDVLVIRPGETRWLQKKELEVR